MLGTQLGAYRIEAELGVGGMGRVYLAEVTERTPDLAAGSRVALKVLHPHLLEAEGFFKRFLREAQIGRSVRHPNIVRTYDMDALALEGLNAHFMVMEYVEGQTLRELSEELAQVPEELCRHIGRETASGLTAIHDAGAIHRDLKPENILITADQVVKIMDLGVARLVDEVIRLSQTGIFVGSVPYAAPEQFSGDPDARADLHAVGLLLYELSAGVHPYGKGSMPELMRRVMEGRPRRLSELNPQTSPFFEEVVHRLLQRDREKRFQTARELHRVLEEGESSSWWQKRAVEIRTETLRPLRRVRIPRDTAVCGRDAEIDRLLELYRKTASGDGQVLLIEGEAGIGKTRLSDELIGRLQAEHASLNFLFGSYPAGGAATAAGAWSTAYREFFGAEGLEASLEEFLSITPTLLPAFAALLRGEPPPTGYPPLAKDSIHTLFVHATRALAERMPTIVLIEDLHFAPEEGRALFAALALAVPEHRILLIGTSRPGLPEDWRTNLDRPEHCSRIELGRLGPKDLVKLLVEAFQSERLAEELGIQIAVKSDGNPFYAFEIIRSLRETNLIRKDESGTWISTQKIREIQIPSSVLDLVQARIADLQEPEQELLEVAACCGFEFDPILVSEVVGIERIPALRRLGQLERAHRLVRAMGRKFAFDHHQVQEALYRGLSDLLREQYHAAIGDVLLTREPEPAGAMAVDICEHFLRGREGAKAKPILTAALDHLDSGYLNDQAIRLADRSLSAPGLFSEKERVELLLRRDGRLDIMGRREEQRDGLDLALELSAGTESPALKARVKRALGWLLIRTADYAGALALLQSALELAREAGDRKLESQVSGNLGVVLRRLGKVEDARVQLERSLVLAEEVGDGPGMGAAMGNLGLVHHHLGELEEARELFERGLAVARECGDQRGAAAAVGNLGLVFKSLGRFEEAQSYFELDLELSRETGDRQGEAIATGNLGNVLESLGRYQEAYERQERAFALSRETGDRMGEVLSLGNLAAVCWGLGLAGEALIRFESSCALAEELGDRHGEAFAIGEVARILTALGRHAEAREKGEGSLALSRKLGLRHQEAYALHVLGALAGQEGRPEDARELHRECLALRRELGEKSGVAATLTALAGLDVDPETAANMLDEALALALETSAPDRILAATVAKARLPGGDVESAVFAVEQHEPYVGCADKMDALFRLFELTGDRTHLEQAHSLLTHLRDQAPEEYRESMMSEVPLHRKILEAWR